MASNSNVILLLLVFTFLLSHTESCCCTWSPGLCGCNFFGCACDYNGDGWCYYGPLGVTGKCEIDRRPGPEKCSDFRYKRSISSVSFEFIVMAKVPCKK